jgi:hypothetical protein
MTQHDLAQATGMPQPSIARIERGTVVPRAATLVEILRATGHRLEVEPIGPVVNREVIRRQLGLAVPRRTGQALGRRARTHMTSPVHILRRLRRFGVPFVLIGELAEVAHGSNGKVGRAIEICRATTAVATERLELALNDLGAAADKGRLRVLTETAAGDDYEVLLRNATSMPVEAGIMVRVAAIEDLIRIRRALGTSKDLEAAAVLGAIVEESGEESPR